MLEVFTGKVGGGKSYCLVDRMLLHMAQGGIVVTNLHMFASGLQDALWKRYKWKFRTEQYLCLDEDTIDIQKFSRYIPHGSVSKKVLVCIDEAPRWFDAVSHDPSEMKLTMDFLRHSRHYFVDLIFITQDFSMLLKRVRVLALYVWVLTDMKTFKFAGLRIGWPLDQILARQYHPADFESGKAQSVRRRFINKSKLTFKCYDSFCHVDGLEVGEGLKGDVKTDWSGGKAKKEEETMGWVGILFFAMQTIVFFVACRYGYGQLKDIKSDIRSLEHKRPAVISSKAVLSPASEVHTVNAAEMKPKSVDDFRLFKEFDSAHCSRVVDGKPIYSRVVIDGLLYEVGSVTPYGTVKRLDNKMVLLETVDGKPFFIINHRRIRNEETEEKRPGLSPESILNRKSFLFSKKD